MEIGRNVLAALPDGGRFEDATETGISNKISENRDSRAQLNPTLTVCLRG